MMKLIPVLLIAFCSSTSVEAVQQQVPPPGKPPKQKQEQKGSNEFPASYYEGKPDRRVQLDRIDAKNPPKIEAVNWINSDARSLKDLKGKIVVLDFWATWCGPCIKSIPKNNALAEKYKDKVVLIGVCHDRGAEKMDQVVKDKGIKYPVCHDKDNTIIDAYKVDSYPDYYIIDKQGRLRIADCSNGKVEDVIKILLKEQ